MTKTITEYIMQYCWRLNKNGTKCGLQNKHSAKISLHFHWPKQDKMIYYNIISSSCIFAIFLLGCIRSHCADAGGVTSSIPTRAIIEKMQLWWVNVNDSSRHKVKSDTKKGTDGRVSVGGSVILRCVPCHSKPTNSLSYHHMDAVMMCSDWDPDPLNIL